MKMQRSVHVVLVVAVMLLAANLVIMFAVHSASPAEAQARVPVGIAAVVGPGAPETGPTVFVLWSNGDITQPRLRW